MNVDAFLRGFEDEISKSAAMTLIRPDIYERMRQPFQWGRSALSRVGQRVGSWFGGGTAAPPAPKPPPAPAPKPPRTPRSRSKTAPAPAPTEWNPVTAVGRGAQWAGRTASSLGQAYLNHPIIGTALGGGLLAAGYGVGKGVQGFRREASEPGSYYG